VDGDVPIRTPLVPACAGKAAVCCRRQHGSCICALGSSCEKCGCISVIACCFLVLRKPPAALITLSSVPFAKGLSSPVVGIDAEGSSSGERNNSLGGECEGKTKPKADCTLLRDMRRCRMLPGGRRARACCWQELTAVSCFRAQRPPCLSWGRKGTRRGAPGPVLLKGELVPKLSEVGDRPIPWCLFLSCAQAPKTTSGCRRGMTSRGTAGQGTLTPLL